MKSEFKAGDLVFEVRGECIMVGKLTKRGENTVRLEGGSTTYIPSGNALGNKYMGKLFHTTPENRQALVTLYGEDAVPELPLRGSELTKKLLEKQKYVLCWTAAQSDDIARKHEELAVIEFMDDREEWFVCVDGHGYNHAVPVDMNGNEITEIGE